MPISVRLKPELERLLAEASRREGKSRSAIIHDALSARFGLNRPRLGQVIRKALAVAPDGFALERSQPGAAERRDWKR